MTLQSTRVFISYSRREKDFVQQLTLRLQNRCIVWWDQRLSPATLWWKTILDEIEGCDCFVLILTASYATSIFCLAELEYAQALGKPILPLVMDRAVKFPPGVAHSQAAFVEGFVVGEAYGEILSGLTGLSPEQRKQGKSGIPRPPEPAPSQAEQLSNVYADAAETEANGNLLLAEHLYELVINSDAEGALAALALTRLNGLKQTRRCRNDYENVVRLAARPETLSHALDLWRVYIANCGTTYDPQGLARDPRFVASAAARRKASLWSPSQSLKEAMQDEIPTERASDEYAMRRSMEQARFPSKSQLEMLIEEWHRYKVTADAIRAHVQNGDFLKVTTKMIRLLDVPVFNISQRLLKKYGGEEILFYGLPLEVTASRTATEKSREWSKEYRTDHWGVVSRDFIAIAWRQEATYFFFINKETEGSYNDGFAPTIAKGDELMPKL